jgi:hypothetical protein
MEQLTARDVLGMVATWAKWFQEKGHSDMRIILHFVVAIKSAMDSGKSRDEIILAFDDMFSDGFDGAQE